MKYCQRCGSQLAEQTAIKSTCAKPGCGYVAYHNPKAAVGVVLYTDERTIVLSRRGREPFAGALDIIGGFLDRGETLEDALKREFTEESGQTSDALKNVRYLTSYHTWYPWMGEDESVTSAAFLARIDDVAALHASDDVAELVRYDITTANPEDFEEKFGVWRAVEAAIAVLKENSADNR